MTDEIERAIRDEVMTLESNGSLWVLAEDYRALLARAEAAEAELHKERARVLSLESEVAALRETHRADIAAGADLETKLAAAQEALALLDAPARPAPVTGEILEPVDRALRHIEGCLTFPVATEINERGYDTRTPTPETVQYMVDIVIEARAALRALAGENGDD